MAPEGQRKAHWVYLKFWCNYWTGIGFEHQVSACNSTLRPLDPDNHTFKWSAFLETISCNKSCVAQSSMKTLRNHADQTLERKECILFHYDLIVWTHEAKNCPHFQLEVLVICGILRDFVIFTDNSSILVDSVWYRLINTVGLREDRSTIVVLWIFLYINTICIGHFVTTFVQQGCFFHWRLTVCQSWHIIYKSVWSGTLLWPGWGNQ